MSNYCWSIDGCGFFTGSDSLDETVCAALDDVDESEVNDGVEIERWIGEVGCELEDPDPCDGKEYEVRHVRRLVVTSFANDATGTRIGYRFNDGATGVAEWVVDRRQK